MKINPLAIGFITGIVGSAAASSSSLEPTTSSSSDPTCTYESEKIWAIEINSRGHRVKRQYSNFNINATSLEGINTTSRSTVTLQTYAMGDLDADDEYYTVVDEDGTKLGINGATSPDDKLGFGDHTISECATVYNRVDFEIPMADIQRWLEDGVISITMEMQTESVHGYCDHEITRLWKPWAVWDGVYVVFDWCVEPSLEPTQTVSTPPSWEPSSMPSLSEEPSKTQSVEPTAVPTFEPTVVPTFEPSSTPTRTPSTAPSTTTPSLAPSLVPSSVPSSIPSWISEEPSDISSLEPTASPTFEPTIVPTTAPTSKPSSEPTQTPSTAPTTITPTPVPSTSKPTQTPTVQTRVPTSIPTSSPTASPTTNNQSKLPVTRGKQQPTIIGSTVGAGALIVGVICVIFFLKRRMGNGNKTFPVQNHDVDEFDVDALDDNLEPQRFPNFDDV